MKTLGVISMSGDPITRGHLWMVKEALRLFTYVDILFAENAGKNYLFPLDLREQLARESVREYFADVPDIESRVTIRCQHEADYIALSLDDNYDLGYDTVSFVRGLRDGIDMAYEQQLMAVNRKVCPNLSTIYLIPPLEIQHISSSLVKKQYLLKSWHLVADDFVTPCVADALQTLSIKYLLKGIHGERR